MNSNDTNQSQENKQKKIDWKKYFTKKHLSVYAAIVATIALVVVLALLPGCKDADNEPEQTTPVETTPAATDPEETTTSAPIVTYPSDEESDPKQEDVFYD